MIIRDDFLLEIGTGELPTQSLQKLSSALAEGLGRALTDASLSFDTTEIFSTPRRLAVLIKGLIAIQETRSLKKMGPMRNRAYDEQGNLTAAAIGFARSCNVDFSSLTWEGADQNERLVYAYEEPGKMVDELMPDLVQKVVAQLPIAKRMRWGDYDTEFARPVHWVVMLYGSRIIEGSLLGQKTSNQSYGHRFHSPQAITIVHANQYASLLETQGKVVASFEERRNRIRHQVLAVAGGVGGNGIVHDELLDEVTALVEWPVALVASFSPDFLTVPREALICAMHNHQKSFHVEDNHGHLLPHFVAVANIESKDQHQVIAGNERVMRARLTDAKFFYETDLKNSLSNANDKLAKMVFQAKLGTLADKSVRIASLATLIAKQIDGDADLAEQAAMLCKADLVSEMVKEFPELQGIMGYYYAKAEGKPSDVAMALREHYLPRFAADDLPTTKTGSALALADRLDTLIGIFGINLVPTGEKDPFALRRAALGVLRIIIENQLPLDLLSLLEAVQKNYKLPLSNPEVVAQTFAFMLERLRAVYQEQNISPDVFAAVMARKPSKPFDFHQRMLAVNHFCQLPDAVALAAANKRVSKLLQKEGQETVLREINVKLLVQPEERALAELIREKQEKTAPLYRAGLYQEALTELATLRAPIDHFFDGVMVMVDDEKLRMNRLAILANLRDLFLQIADISMLNS